MTVIPDLHPSTVPQRPDVRAGTLGISSWMSLAGMSLVWAGPFLILSAIVGGLTGLAFMPGGYGLLFCPLLGVFATYSIYLIAIRSRRRDGEILLGYLHTAVRLNLPLVSFLKAAERSETGRRQRLLGDFIRELESGLPVSAALWYIPDVPERAARWIAAAEPLGQLNQALARSVTTEMQTDDAQFTNPDRDFYRLYQVYLLGMLSFVSFGFMLFVLPQFRQIFSDFKTPLPWITEWVFGLSDQLVNNDIITLLVFAFILGIILIFIGYYFTRVFIPSMILPRVDIVADWFAWRLPYLGGLQRHRALAESCELISNALCDGIPLPVALERAGALKINTAFKRRLVEFRNGLLRGVPAADAAKRAAMPALLVGMLTPITSTADAGTGEMFGFMARYYSQRFSRSLMLLRAASEPFFVICFGILVLIFVLACFTPIVSLIQSVMPSNTGGVL